MPSRDEVKNKTKEILESLGKEERILLKKVINAEKERIHMKTPHGIYDDIKQSVKNTIQ